MREHRDLAESVVAAEIDQDDVHDVRAAAERHALLEEVPGDRLERARHRRQREPGHADPDEPGEDRIARRGAAATTRPGWSRQPRERHQHQDGRDHLDDELGQGEIRRGEVQERERHDEPDHAREDDGDEPLAVPDHAAERGGGEHDRRHDAERRERQERAAHRRACRCRGAGCRAEHERDHEEQGERALTASRCRTRPWRAPRGA